MPPYELARDWLRELVERPEHEHPHFVAALSLIAALPPSEVVQLLRTRLRRLAEQRAETRTVIDATLAQDVHPLFLVEEEYRLTLLDAESSFRRRVHRPHHPPADRLGPDVGPVPRRTLHQRREAPVMTPLRSGLIVRVRDRRGRRVRLRIPLVPAVLAASPVLLLGAAGLAVASVISRANPLGALRDGGRLLGAVRGTRLEFERGHTAVLVDIR